MAMSSFQGQKAPHRVPHQRQTRYQLMIVLEQRQRDIRSASRELLDRAGVHGSVVQALENERRLAELGSERIVPQAVFKERKIERLLFAGAVVKERQRSAAAPLYDPLRRQEVMSRLGEHDGGRHQHQPIDALAKPRRGQDGERAAETRPNQHSWRLTAARKRLIELI